MHPSHFSLSLLAFVVLARLTRAAPAAREKTGATPLFLPLVRHAGGGGVTPGVTSGVTSFPLPLWGRSRLNVSLREGFPARKRAGRFSSGIVRNFRLGQRGRKVPFRP